MNWNQIINNASFWDARHYCWISLYHCLVAGKTQTLGENRQMVFKFVIPHSL